MLEIRGQINLLSMKHNFSRSPPGSSFSKWCCLNHKGNMCQMRQLLELKLLGCEGEHDYYLDCPFATVVCDACVSVSSRPLYLFSILHNITVVLLFFCLENLSIQHIMGFGTTLETSYALIYQFCLWVVVVGEFACFWPIMNCCKNWI